MIEMPFINHYQIAKEERRKAYKENHGRKLVECSACSGSGRYDHNGSPKCGACNGTGKELTAPTEVANIQNIKGKQ